MTSWLTEGLRRLAQEGLEDNEGEFDRTLVELVRKALGEVELVAFRLVPSSPPIGLTGTTALSRELTGAVDKSRTQRRSIVQCSSAGDAIQWILYAGNQPRYAFAGRGSLAGDIDGVTSAIESYVSLHGRLVQCQRDLAFYQALVQTLVAIRPGPLTECLRLLAGLAAVLTRGQAAMVIAVDEDGDPIGAGTWKWSVDDEEPALDQLVLLVGETSRAEDLRGGVLPASLLHAGDSTKCIRWMPIHEKTGYLLLVLDPETEPSAVAMLADALARPIRAALSWETNQRVMEVQKLVRNLEVSHLGLQSIVDDLAKVFASDAVTLFLRTRDRLRLAATTDRRLYERATARDSDLVEYHPDEPQLTSYVFREGRSLRLKDSTDARLVTDRTKMTGRTCPRFPEYDLHNEILIQFLGVPVRRRGEVTGVVRISRKGTRVSFTRQDENALQLFGDLLGVILAEHDETSMVKSILQSTSESILVIAAPEHGAPPTIEIANEGAARLFGREAKEMRGLAAGSLFPSGNLRQMIRNKDATGEFVESEVVRPDGSRCTLLGSFWRLENTLVTPSATRILSIARDVTELRREQRRYLDLLASMGVAYFRDDTSGQTLVPSEVEASITGYSVEQLKKMNRADLFFNPKERALQIAKARLAGGTLGKQVVKWKHASGRPIWIETDFRIYQEPDGSEIVEGVHRDVTYQVELREFLNEKDHQLDDARLFAKLKREAETFYDYLPSFAHQLYSPLVAMRNTADKIASGEIQGEELRQRLGWVIGQTNVCIDMVQNHSYLNKVLRGEKFPMAPVDLGVLVLRVKNDFLHLLQTRHLQLTIDNHSVQNLRGIMGHEALLRQVVVNLLDNAIKYSLDQTTITVQAQRSDGRVVMTVSNQGLPIEDDLRPRLFQRGVRGWRAEAVIPEGTGLGLWLVKKILDIHGATIALEEAGANGLLNVFRIQFRS